MPWSSSPAASCLTYRCRMARGRERPAGTASRPAKGHGDRFVHLQDKGLTPNGVSNANSCKEVLVQLSGRQVPGTGPLLKRRHYFLGQELQAPMHRFLGEEPAGI